MKGIEALNKAKASTTTSFNAAELNERCQTAMADDLNSPMVISALFDYVKIFNSLADGSHTVTTEDLTALKQTVKYWVEDVLGLKDEKAATSSGKDMVTPLVEMLLNMRLEAKAAKNWALSDQIRDQLTAIGIRVKDRKDGFDWEIE